MSLALQSLVGLTLVVCGAVAALPDLMSQRQPRSLPPVALSSGLPLWVVQAGDEHWFINGIPLDTVAMAQVLRHQTLADDIRFLPSAALSLGQVTSSLAWLRRQSPRPVALELNGPPR
jgi:hypothetical protein